METDLIAAVYESREETSVKHTEKTIRKRKIQSKKILCHDLEKNLRKRERAFVRMLAGKNFEVHIHQDGVMTVADSTS